ncbi:sigma-54-dependent transcriptional regulator [Raineya orbicola]|uniref:Response regulator containing CheY-like receiver AAA-type ATPase n=1 Tax=Raineya orbicola TaxID=2016530 RepID=A0A2N3IG33_9BACT|nr:sigma-54 dependent transcriptional regulator [Raineya orbicola]PKQ69276.1 Response regulator containing CheY-like receiver AAA-type ATPase [Raineya orbicola]
MAKILIIDDEASIRNALREILEDEKHEVKEAKNGEEGLAMLIEEDFDAAFCDIKMPKMDGMELLRKFRENGKNTQIIMLSAHGNIEIAVEATKYGAYHFLEKPPNLQQLLVTLRNALDKKDLVQENKNLKKTISKVVSQKYEIVGESEVMKQLKVEITRIAHADARVLILGPNGAGKELVARQLHEQSPRKEKPFVEVNCAAIPSELIESELFGHEKGSFTGAIKDKKGKFELADKGTLFLDEIGDMSLSAQAKVLRALQERKITKVGGDKDIEVDVRVIAATNKDLREEIHKGNFREDLFHRLGVLIIKVPSLDERKEDIPLLVNKFLNDIAEEHKTKPKHIEPQAIEFLMQLSWSGNVRELRNVVERLVIMSSDKITLQDAQKYAVFKI